MPLKKAKVQFNQLVTGQVGNSLRKSLIWYRLQTSATLQTLKVHSNSEITVLYFAKKIIDAESNIMGQLSPSDLLFAQGTKELEMTEDPKHPDSLLLYETTINNPIVVYYP